MVNQVRQKEKMDFLADVSYQANRFFLCFCPSLDGWLLLKQICLLNTPTFRLNFTLLFFLFVFSPGGVYILYFICFSPMSECWEVWATAWNLICPGTNHSPGDVFVTIWTTEEKKLFLSLWQITQNKLCCHCSSNVSSPPQQLFKIIVKIQ